VANTICEQSVGVPEQFKGPFGSREYINTTIFKSQSRCHDIQRATEYIVLLFGLKLVSRARV
jgi:hypothetical protein